jgi:hypothetical protein
VVVHVPRRAGKTLGVFCYQVHSAARVRDSAHWYTAQTRETAALVFRKEWIPLVTRSGLYKRGMLGLRRANGSEEVSIKRDGAVSSTIGLFAPGPMAMHSQNADTVVADEAWTKTVEQGSDLEAGVQPAQLTRPESQLLIVSAGGTAASSWLRHWQMLARDSTPGVAMLDYGAPPDADPDDPAVWLESHPAIGHTITLEAVAQLRSTMKDAEFQRAILGIETPDKQITTAKIPAHQWTATLDPLAELPDSRIAFGVEVNAAGQATWVAAAMVGQMVTVELVEQSTGIGESLRVWRALRAKYRARLIADKFGPAAALIARLSKQGTPAVVLTTGEFVAACQDAVDTIESGNLRRREQPALTTAIAASYSRSVGDRWVWDRRTGDIAPTVAMTLAIVGARRARPAGSALIVAG